MYTCMYTHTANESSMMMAIALNRSDFIILVVLEV